MDRLRSRFSGNSHEAPAKLDFEVSLDGPTWTGRTRLGYPTLVIRTTLCNTPSDSMEDVTDGITAKLTADLREKVKERFKAWETANLAIERPGAHGLKGGCCETDRDKVRSLLKETIADFIKNSDFTMPVSLRLADDDSTYIRDTSTFNQVAGPLSASAYPCEYTGNVRPDGFDCFMLSALTNNLSRKPHTDLLRSGKLAVRISDGTFRMARAWVDMDRTLISTPEVRTQVTNLNPIATVYFARLQAKAIELSNSWSGVSHAHWSKARDTMKDISVVDANGGTVKPFENLRVLLRGEDADGWTEARSVEIDDMQGEEADEVTGSSATGSLG